MIIAPFTVGPLTFVDWNTIDSQRDQAWATEQSVGEIMRYPIEIVCETTKVSSTGDMHSFRFGVYDGASLVGSLWLGSIFYQSGPWSDVRGETETDPGATIRVFAAHSPSFFGQALDTEDRHARNTIAGILHADMVTAQGRQFRVDQLSHVINPDATDLPSLRAKRIHDSIASHADIDVVLSQNARWPRLKDVIITRAR